LNAALVAQGWALAYRKYSKDYVDQETEARTHSRGMWGGAFVEPWAWRRGARLPNLAARNGGSS
jgi:endonuclease YncB( thermonuclease family)